MAPQTGATGAVFLEAQKQLIVFADFFFILIYFLFLQYGSMASGFRVSFLSLLMDLHIKQCCFLFLLTSLEFGNAGSCCLNAVCER